MKNINLETLQKWRSNQDNYVLIDVRPFAQYDEKHITDADNIPLEEKSFEDLVEKRVVSKESKIVLYCGGQQCPLSKQAAERLDKAGYTEVYVYEGGLKEWANAQDKAAA